jgi:hypothetical protein
LSYDLKENDINLMMALADEVYDDPEDMEEKIPWKDFV